MAGLSLHHVTRILPGAGRAVLEDFSFEAGEGERVALTGPAGSGKTLLLRIIAGLEPASGGEIHVGGRRVDGLPPRERGVALVFQNSAIYPHLNLYRNLAFGLMVRKMDAEEIDRRVRAAADLLGLAEALDRRPRAISSEQRALVALGRAIVERPRAYLLDEPLGEVFAGARAAMRAEIRRIQEALGATMLYATRDAEEAAALGGRVVEFAGGK